MLSYWGTLEPLAMPFCTSTGLVHILPPTQGLMFFPTRPICGDQFVAYQYDFVIMQTSCSVTWLEEVHCSHAIWVEEVLLQSALQLLEYLCYHYSPEENLFQPRRNDREWNWIKKIEDFVILFIYKFYFNLEIYQVSALFLVTLIRVFYVAYIYHFYRIVLDYLLK